MDDREILDLYFQRSEQAIQETDNKYGSYCFRIAYQVLASREDAQESVSDTYLAAWNAIPPKRPPLLSAFLGKIARNISIDRWRSRSTYKRGGGEFALCLDELKHCASGQPSVEERQLQKEVVQTLKSGWISPRAIRLIWYLVGTAARSTGHTVCRIKPWWTNWMQSANNMV